MISSLDARTHRRTGRTIGVLLLVQLAFAPIANFVLLKPVFAAPGFLENAAAHSLQVSLGALSARDWCDLARHRHPGIPGLPSLQPLACALVPGARRRQLLVARGREHDRDVPALPEPGVRKGELGGWRALSGAAGGGRIGTQLGALHRADRCG